MWTVKILETVRGAGGLLDVSVEYSNSVSGDKASEKFHGVQDKENLDRLIQQKLDYLNAAKAEEITSGDWTAPITVAPPPPPPPTQGEVDRKAFQKSYQLLQHYTRAISVGIIDTSDAGYLVALKDAQDKFMADYINLI